MESSDTGGHRGDTPSTQTYKGHQEAPEGREEGHPGFAAGNTEEQVLARERWPWEQKKALEEPGELLAVSSLSLAQKGNPQERLVQLSPGEGEQGV